MDNRLKIIIDTREQSPWAFPEELATVRMGTLKTGDYALDGDNAFAIERKSLDDFLGTISSGWNRFLREIGRMDAAAFPAKIIIVEGDFESCHFRVVKDGKIQAPTHNHVRLTPQFIYSRIAELSLQGVCILFAGDASCAGALGYAILRHRFMELANEIKRTN